MEKKSDILFIISLYLLTSSSWIYILFWTDDCESLGFDIVNKGYKDPFTERRTRGVESKV